MMTRECRPHRTGVQPQPSRIPDEPTSRETSRGSVVTIKAGAIGNQAPIEIVTEQWYAPEIGEVVLSRRSDPRFGETTYRLQ